ncbi:MAG: M20/M25/M40 family metallo-hydrolase [Spirochaetales bacterium]|nr:M20/M25/M40 family metallo-hydrolase [Spirochaetales bacterium]
MTVLLIFLSLLFILVFILLLRTFAVSKGAPLPPYVAQERENPLAAEKLAQAIRFRTESFSDLGNIDLKGYEGFHHFLRQAFPLVHRHLQRQTISDYAVLYTWQGKDESLQPVVLMAHWDVVPVAPAEEVRWTYPPYGGVLADGYIHGRGSLDDKLSLISIFEAVETLLSQAFQPERTVYLALGGDEEIGGTLGAAATVRYLEERNIRPLWVLDEASVILQGGLLGITRPLALIGVAEKGHADIMVIAQGRDGHASMPPASTAVGILAKAVCRVEKRPSRIRLLPMVRRFLENLAPHTSFALKLVLSNLWLTGPLVGRILAKAPSSNSLVRTTRAFTVLQGSSAENILPEKAAAIANCRILPGDSVQDTLTAIRKAVRDERVTVEVFRPEDSGEPVPPSPLEGEGYKKITETLSEVLPGVVPCPFLFNATTDSRYFSRICDTTIRFMPVILQNEDLSLFHGTNERVSVRNLSQYVEFLVHLLRKT